MGAFDLRFPEPSLRLANAVSFKHLECSIFVLHIIVIGDRDGRRYQLEKRRGDSALD